MPISLAYVFWEFWLFYIRKLYVESIKWTILRVRTPKEILKTPKSMEQVFAAAHASYTFGIKPYDKYWKGKVEDWHSFDMVGHAGGVSFFIRINDTFRNLIESAIYAQYPEAEVEVVDDYTEVFPAVLPNKTYDIFGADLILAKDDAYPIRTYPYFEAMVAEEKVDTMAGFTEAMSHLKGEETLWIQILIRPIGEKTTDWPKRAQKTLEDAIGRKKVETPGFLFGVFLFLKNLALAPFQQPDWSALETPKQEKVALTVFTKGEQEIFRSIEDKISKLAFEGVVRYIYIDHKDAFTRSNVAAINGAFRQFNDERKNGLKPNIPVMTIAKQPFKSKRLYFKKRTIYDRYRLRKIPEKKLVLNTEELASLFHFPTTIVEAPMLKRVEAKKGEPPLTLPIE